VVEDLTALAVRSSRGDRAALTRFVRAAQSDVYRYCQHLSGSDAAADLTQETFVRAIKALPGFEARSSARTWLFAIARRTCADWVRSQQRQARLDERLRGGHDLLAAPASGRIELDLLLASLDSDRREAFVLTQIVGLSYAEAAEVCGCAIGTIRSRVARARFQLLRDLDPQAVGNLREAASD
jgi:RNA polymerase sigma-70 factor (ECF subfamily)